MGALAAELVEEGEEAGLRDHGAELGASGEGDLARWAHEHAPLDAGASEPARGEEGEDSELIEGGEDRGAEELAAELAIEIGVLLEDADRDVVRDELVGEHHPGGAGAGDDDLGFFVIVFGGGIHRVAVMAVRAARVKRSPRLRRA
jgi:hypothetical protein